jgi:hypothetical protein
MNKPQLLVFLKLVGTLGGIVLLYQCSGVPMLAR